MNRAGNLIVLVLYLLLVPAGVYFYFTSPQMGYSQSTAGILAGVLALVGVALIPLVLRKKAVPENVPPDFLPPKTGWIILIGFLIVMAAIVAFFMFKDE
jgi:membrane protein YdbS with pleckstrin-like domain